MTFRKRYEVQGKTSVGVIRRVVYAFDAQEAQQRWAEDLKPDKITPYTTTPEVFRQSKQVL